MVAIGNAMLDPNDERQSPKKELHIAPMLDVSYAEFRYLMRLLTKHAVLWTEMVVDETLIHSDSLEPHLAFDATVEHPIVCQLGGNHPDWTKKAVELVNSYGYDEVNLNAECPSSRVASQKEFGAALMKDVDLTVRMLQAMQQSSAASGSEKIPVSIKTRIAVDEHEDWDSFLLPFIKRLVHEGGCRRFYLHARKVFTQGIRPAQNRNIPPLDYSKVYRLCQHFPECDFWLNGGIQSLQKARLICYGTKAVARTDSQDDNSNDAESGASTEDKRDRKEHGRIPCILCEAPHGSCVAPPQGVAPLNLRGCMMGRAAMDNPSVMGNADCFFYGAPSNPSRNRRHVLNQYAAYLEKRYPRRCCDACTIVTTEFPSPLFDPYPGASCPVCGHVVAMVGGVGVHMEPIAVADDDELPTSRVLIKISARVMDRALKPVLGMFFGLRGTKTWRRAFNELSRDERIRNCGPGFVLHQAMKRMPEELLDMPFSGESST